MTRPFTRRRVFKVTGKKLTTPSEHKIQSALIEYLRLALRPELEARAVPNGEKRHISVANRLKSEGVRRGTPDIFICLPHGRIAWLEMKAAGGSLSPEQKAFRDKVQALGHFWGMARSIDEAIVHLRLWGALKSSHETIDAFHEAASIHVGLRSAVDKQYDSPPDEVAA